MNTILSIVIFLAIGALAGWLACLLTKTKGTLLFSILLGIVGAFVGSWLGGLLGLTTGGILSFSVPSILSAVVGAVVVVFVARLIFGKK